MVYWRDCDTVTLMRSDGGLKFVKEVERTSIGKGKLDAGLALIFLWQVWESKRGITTQFSKSLYLNSTSLI
jgi:hypothetical protein